MSGNNDIYYQKYMKYKNKYLELKQIQEGGISVSGKLGQLSATFSSATNAAGQSIRTAAGQSLRTAADRTSQSLRTAADRTGQSLRTAASSAGQSTMAAVSSAGQSVRTAAGRASESAKAGVQNMKNEYEEKKQLEFKNIACQNQVNALKQLDNAEKQVEAANQNVNVKVINDGYKCNGAKAIPN